MTCLQTLSEFTTVTHRSHVNSANSDYESDHFQHTIQPNTDITHSVSVNSCVTHHVSTPLYNRVMV